MERLARGLQIWPVVIDAVYLDIARRITIRVLPHSSNMSLFLFSVVLGVLCVLCVLCVLLVPMLSPLLMHTYIRLKTPRGSNTARRRSCTFSSGELRDQPATAV